MFRVMIVDDKEIFRRKMKRLKFFCQNNLFQIVQEAEDGEEALEILEEHPVDVLITDIRMPKIDGIELLKLVKQKNLCKCVVLLSEYSDFSYAKEGLVYGAFDYIVKPADDEKIEQVMNRVERFLNDNDNELILIKAENMLFPVILNQHDRIENVNDEIIGRLTENEHMQTSEKIVFIKSLLEQLYREIVQKKPQIMLYYNVKEMLCLPYIQEEKADELILYYKYITKYLADSFSRLWISADNDMITRIVEYIIENIDQGITLKMISEEYFMNSKYLSVLFHKVTGMSYMEYATEIKMARAAYLLTETDEKVYEIAQKLGFEDAEYFSRIFKDCYNKTPNMYKKELEEWKRLRAEVIN